MLADSCDFADEILQDRLVFRIKDDKVRERLPRKTGLTLHKTDSGGNMVTQMKVVSYTSETSINLEKSGHNTISGTYQSTNIKPLQQCWNCGRTHEYHTKELCPLYGKTCNKCQKQNHFAVKCQSKVRGSQRHVKAIDRDDPDEVFPMEVSTMDLDDSQYVTL